MNSQIPKLFSDMPLWTGAAPLGQEGDAESPGRYEEHPDGIYRLTDVGVPTISFFPATAANRAARPAVVVCPGGGYSILSMNQEGRDIAWWLASAGVSAFLLKYRCPDRRDAALADAARAVRLIRANAAAWGVAPDKVGILGFSAGAHLAARLSTLPAGAEPYPKADAIDEQPCRPDFQMPIYPAYIFRDGYGTDPDFAIDKATVPPAFIAQSADDVWADSSLAYAIALKKAGVPVELHLYSDGGHGYGMLREHGRTPREWPAAAERWLFSTVLKEWNPAR